MKCSLCLAGLVGLATLAHAVPAEEKAPSLSSESPAELRAELEAFVTQPRFAGAQWGIKVVSLDTGRTLFEHGANLRLSPASNSKLYSTALAFATLGADYRIVTPLRATAAPDSSGVIHGDLIIAGRGDPSWNFRDGKRDFWAVFDPFVAALRRAGVAQITGEIVADATWLREPPQGASWTADDLEDDFGAEISAVTLGDNYADLRITPAAIPGQPCAAELLQPLTGLSLDNRMTTGAAGSDRVIRLERIPGEKTLHLFGTLPAGGGAELAGAPVPRPAAWFAAALREALFRSGISVGGLSRALRWPDPPAAGQIALGELPSPPLRELAARYLKISQNLETDLVFGHLGEERRTAATPAWARSDELAAAALDEFMTRIGVPPGAVVFDEGSGLSRNNLTTAAATVHLLAVMARRPEADAWMAALPVAGLNGTLRKHLRGTAAEGNVRAKTGSLRWVSALSGYVTAASGEKLAFSLLLNRQLAAPGRKNSEELDEIVVRLANYAGPK